MEIKPWKTLQSESALDVDAFRVRKEVCQLPDGTIIQDHYVREQADGVIVLCVTTDDQVVLVRQYRHAVGEITTELPGGYISRHDMNPAEAARRELLEETGYSSERMEEVAVLVADAAYSTARIHLFAALPADKITAPQFRPREQTETVLVPKSELMGLIADGTICSLAQVAAIAKFSKLLN